MSLEAWSEGLKWCVIGSSAFTLIFSGARAVVDRHLERARNAEKLQQQQIIEQLKRRTDSRILSNTEIEAYLNRLSMHPGTTVEVVSVAGDTESQALAKQMAEVLTRAGWQVEPPAQAFFDGPVTGIEVSVKNTTTQNKGKLLASGLLAKGWKARGRIDQDIHTEVRLVVGSR